MCIRLCSLFLLFYSVGVSAGGVSCGVSGCCVSVPPSVGGVSVGVWLSAGGVSGCVCSGSVTGLSGVGVSVVVSFSSDPDSELLSEL